MDFGEEQEGEDEVDFFGEYEGGRNDRKERHGYGKAVLPNKDIYQGQYMNGKRDGYGVYKFKSRAAKGAKYTGNYYQGRKQGYGVFVYPDGSRYQGNWVDDMKEGQGTYFYVNGDTYEGEWSQNRRHGFGTYTFKASSLKYEGAWHKGSYDGYGTVVYPNFKYQGRFRSNRAYGQGKFVFDTCCEMHGKYTLPKTEAKFVDYEQEAALMMIDRALASGGEDGDVNLEEIVIPGTPPPIEEATNFRVGDITGLYVMTEEEAEEARLVAEIKVMKEKLDKKLAEAKEEERKKAEEEAARLAREEAERAALENQAAEEKAGGEEGDEGEEVEDKGGAGSGTDLPQEGEDEGEKNTEEDKVEEEAVDAAPADEE